MSKILLLFLFCQVTFCQTFGEKLLHGKIIVESGTVGGVTIINLVNEKMAISDGDGDFFILAKAEDLLVFSAVNLDYHRRIIEDEDLKSEVLIINMTAKITELEEVIVNKHPEINAVSMGISPKGIVHRTQMERKLYTAGDFKPIHLLGLLGGSLQVDPILNAINGRTAMVKKSIEVEKKERLLAYIGVLFDDEYYTSTLKIPAIYIKGFQYYCIEKEE
ncbi:MAG TPA: hypothetical protein VLR29_06740, partial [Flavobacterium sp.]|nr:hypothetical protein [Flavobacterium sp.]